MPDTLTSAPGPAVRSPAPILFALWLTVFAASSQVIIVSPILPDIAQALSVPEAHLGWIVTAYAAALGVFALVAGPVSDRVGRRRILLYGTLAMTVVLGLHALATTFARFLAVRALAGAAGGLLSGAAVAYVGDYFPYERRGWASGWVMSGIAAGQVLGVPAGKWLTLRYGLQAPFLAFAAMTAVAFFLVLTRVPQPDVLRSQRPLTLGEGLRGYVRLFRQPGPRAAMFAYVLMFGGLGLFIPYFPTWLERAVGIRGQSIALLFLVGGLTNVVVAPLAGRISDRMGRKPVVLASALLFAAIMLAVHARGRRARLGDGLLRPRDGVGSDAHGPAPVAHDGACAGRGARVAHVRRDCHRAARDGGGGGARRHDLRHVRLCGQHVRRRRLPPRHGRGGVVGPAGAGGSPGVTTPARRPHHSPMPTPKRRSRSWRL